MTHPPHLSRRNLLRLGTLAATGSLFTRFQPAMAGPFTGADFEKLVPADKKLSAAWIRSLFERGEPEWSGGTLYLAALRAGAVMAREMGDASFAKQCDELVESGGKWLAENLFDGEYFYQKRDPKHPEAIGAGIGCLIDQVFGQGWAHQLSLGRVLPRDKTVTALKSLWRYDFTLPATLKRTGKRILITLATPAEIAAGGKLVVTIS